MRLQQVSSTEHLVQRELLFALKLACFCPCPTASLSCCMLSFYKHWLVFMVGHCPQQSARHLDISMQPVEACAVLACLAVSTALPQLFSGFSVQQRLHDLLLKMYHHGPTHNGSSIHYYFKKKKWFPESCLGETTSCPCLLYLAPHGFISHLIRL